MRITSRIKQLAERLTGGRLYSEWQIPRGVDLFRDIATDLKNLRVEMVFDVGANVGQSALAFLAGFPAATIDCFEPAEATYRTLQVALEPHKRARAHRLALGTSPGRALLLREGNSSTFRLLARGEKVSAEAVEEVEIATLDTFCASYNIARIDYLKIDTEGADLHVLQGATRMLGSHAIGLVQVEAGMNPRNTLHVPLEAFKAFLEPRGYFLFALYEQWPETPTKRPHLRRTNPVFVSERVIEANPY